MIKFKYFKTLATYNNNASTIGNDDIVFIQDDNTLRTHGKTYYFASSAAAGITSSDISNWNGKTSNTGTITSVGNTSSGAVTVSSSNNTASWGSAVTVGSVGGVDLKFTMPSNPGGPDGNTQYYMTVNGSVTGTSGSNNLGTIYAPTTAGTSEQYLKSSGSGAPTWATMPSYLTSVPTEYKKSYAIVVGVSANKANVTCPSTFSANGEECTVLYVNSGTSSDYSVTVSTTYKTPDGEQLDLTCPIGGYCEVNYLKLGNTIYARGV